MRFRCFMMMVILLSTIGIAGRNAVITEVSGSYVVEIEAAKGWNLLPEGGLTHMDFKERTVLSSLLMPMYYYLPINKQYVKSEGGYNDEDFALVRQNSDYLKLGARWYYFKESTPVFLKIDKGIAGSKLYRGWNLMTYVPQMFYNDLELGDCSVERLYRWNPFLASWERNQIDLIFGTDAEDDLVGYGFAIKVADSCTLGSVEVIPSVPEIPQ